MTDPLLPSPSDPVGAIALPGGTTEAHSRAHGRTTQLVENVKAWGAVGDGVHDDGPAIQAASDWVGDYAAGQHGTLFFPGGHYKVTSTLDLSSQNYQHWVGGHINADLIQWDNAPQVVIDGTAIASGPVMYVDGGPSFAGGSSTFENITFRGKETGASLFGGARWLFKNCGFAAMTNTSTADNCGLLLHDVFWTEFRDCTMHSADATTLPSIILRGSNASANITAVTAAFRYCVLSGEVLSQQQAGGLPPSVQFYDTYTENTPTCMLRFTEDSITDNSPCSGLIFVNCGIADAGVSPVPLVLIEAAHTDLWGPLFDTIQAVPGAQIIQRATAHYADTWTNGLKGVQVRGSNRSAYKIVDGSGNATGGYAMTKDVGWHIVGGATTSTETDIFGNAGHTLNFARSGDLYSRFGLEADGLHSWGPGGSDSGGYDTNLYRNAANVLKTDDKFIATAGLGVGNATVASWTTLGNKIAKIEVFDASGASLGFIPVYQSIT